jgi:spermidine/putrescine transport system substrate-binding protein
MNRINRRMMVGAMTAAILTGSTTLAVAAGEIRVLNWQGYGTDEAFATEAFEKKTGVKVVHDYFTSEQEMLTKLRTNPGAYDVVLVNSAFTGQAKAEGLIAKIDTADMPNVKDLAPSMGQNPDLVMGGDVYGVAWTWGATGLAVNKDAVTTPPTSLAILWDPQYAGKVSIRDDGVEAVQFAALALGQDMNDIKDLEAVKAKLKALMPQIKTFWSSENDWNQFFSAGDFTVSTFWSGGAGRSITNQDAARAFINWMIDPEFYVQWAAKGAPSSANAKANAALPESDFNKQAFADPAVVERVKFMKPLSDETRKIYTELWQDVKAAQ